MLEKLEKWVRPALQTHATRCAHETTVAAAVLLPLVCENGLCRVILTRRTDHLHHHPGQISFPGGRIEATDADTVAAALRETEEEIGLPTDTVHVLGHLPAYDTTTGFTVYPVVGFIDPLPLLTPDPFEVAEILHWPLSLFLNLNRYEQKTLTHEGQKRQYHALTHDGHTVWGATAGILHAFATRLHACPL
jgi:8-oxo-dGTP pyrophosphatase MutT (NUDIX family)